MADSNNVRVAVTGAWYVGQTSTTAPTSATSSLDAGFKDLGYVSSDGITITRDRSTNALRAWQNSDLVRESVTEASMTFSGMLMETTTDTLELFYGSAVGVDGSIEIQPGETGGRKSFVIDVVDGTETIRYYIPEGEILSVGEQVLANGEAVGYNITVTAYASSEGFTVKKWVDSLAA
jgi:hypothetical protein